MKNKLVKILAFMILTASPAFASRLVGNGGDGVRIDGKIYVLDLVEAGAELDPYFANVETNHEIQNLLERKLRYLPDMPTALLARKLSEVAQKSPAFGYALATLSAELSWNLVATELLPIDDEDTSLSFSAGSTVQLAARRHFTVYLDRKLWAEIDDKNKVALILHELIYMLTPPTPVTENGKEMRQSSLSARALNGQLFREGWDKTEVNAWAAERLFSASVIGKILPKADDRDFVYRVSKGSFARAAHPDHLGLGVTIDGGAETPVSLKLSSSNEMLANACVESGRALRVSSSLLGLKLRASIMVASLGEEWTLAKTEYCQSLDEHGKCVKQTYARFELRTAKDATQILDRTEFAPLNSGSYLAGAAAEHGLRECVAGLRKKFSEITAKPFRKD